MLNNKDGNIKVGDSEIKCMNKKIYRHGDVSLYEVDSMPIGETKKVGSFICALGETTGHKHVLTAEPQTLIEILEAPNGRRYLKLNGQAQLTHEEHKTITVLPGIYEQRQEREFDWFQMATRRVVD